MKQQIRFCQAADGVRLAYATHGRGPTIVKVANWITHVEFDWRSPLWEPWWTELGSRHRVVRYDERGCGLSDRDPSRLDLDALVGDLETVVDAAGLDRFALLGISQGGAVAVRYAVDHPDRVSHLVLANAYARGRELRDVTSGEREEQRLLEEIVRVGWGRPDPSFRRLFTRRLAPGASEGQMVWFDELMRISVTPELAVRLRSAWASIDVANVLDRVSVPTLVAHSRGDRAVPFDQGRLLATRIPDARLLPLDSVNHVLLSSESAWPVFVSALRDFLGTSTPGVASAPSLSPREVDVLRLVSQGYGNEQIADQLVLSTRTVERHLSNTYTKLGLSGRSARAAAAAWMSRSDTPTGP